MPQRSTSLHPVWLLVYRLLAFIVLLIMLSLNGVSDGGKIFCYYTHWTFALITIFFGLGSLISMYGCYKHHKKVGGDRIANLKLEGDVDQGTLHYSEPQKFIKVVPSMKEFACNGQDRELLGEAALNYLNHTRLWFRSLVGIGKRLNFDDYLKQPYVLHHEETSSAQYRLQQYIAASGGQKFHNCIHNIYAMRKVQMLAFDSDTAAKTVKSKKSSRTAKVGGFVLW